MPTNWNRMSQNSSVYRPRFPTTNESIELHSIWIMSRQKRALCSKSLMPRATGLPAFTSNFCEQTESISSLLRHSESCALRKDLGIGSESRVGQLRQFRAFVFHHEFQHLLRRFVRIPYRSK